jgi:iron-sulfur cluster assembly protein
MTETKSRPCPAAVLLTPAAEQRIADLMAQAPADAIGVKLSTPRRGCSGLAYSVDYVTSEAAFDEKIETPGGTAGFVFENPNAKGACGCGESFMV